MQRNGEPAENIRLNVYDLHWTNEYTSALGLGVFHTGVEAYGIEFGFGGHPFPVTGVFEMVPKCAEELGDHFSFRETINLGTTSLSEEDIHDIVETLSPRYLGDQYHLLRYNCNHFSTELAQILCGANIPGWINRLANMASSIPFMERALPKEWLTPCGLQTMASTNVGINESNRQRNGSISSDFLDLGSSLNRLNMSSSSNASRSASAKPSVSRDTNSKQLSQKTSSNPGSSSSSSSTFSFKSNSKR